MTSSTTTATTNDLFPSLISDIKSYSGDDPLLPWLRGVRKLRDSLPPQLLREKLPRFLQKCAQSFDSDRRYRNDLRYLRIWLQLMDYVDDPKALLRNMETKKIGVKKSLFYQAYALYYEKVKKFDDADQMYRLGVRNLAEPLDELQKSYEQFIQRMERHKNKRVQRHEKKIARKPLSDPRWTNPNCSSKENDEGSQNLAKPVEQNKLYRDDSVVTKFVDAAIVESSKSEDVCHHGLLEPTLTMKEAMNAINDMFREPIEPANGVSRSSRGQPKVSQELQEPLKIFIDDESSNDSKPSETKTSMDGSPTSSGVNTFVFLRPNDHHSESSGEMKPEKSSRKTRSTFREDTVVRRFVGSAILDEPEVEDICHHGLVDPTINLKEAMEDINDMFGKPIDFVRTTRRKRKEKATASGKNDRGGFSILPDDEFNAHEGNQLPETSSSKTMDAFHEPTVFTKEAMDDINNLFRMPLDF